MYKVQHFFQITEDFFAKGITQCVCQASNKLSDGNVYIDTKEIHFSLGMYKGREENCPNTFFFLQKHAQVG